VNIRAWSSPQKTAGILDQMDSTPAITVKMEAAGRD
jgi:hypothetical protein